MAELSVKIKADIANVLRNLDKLEKELKDVDKQALKTNKAFSGQASAKERRIFKAKRWLN